MQTGLLWYSDHPGKSLADKIGQAARRYRQKHGTSPDVCYVHPSALSGNNKLKKVGDVHVSSSPTVLVHHFWIGEENKKVPARRKLHKRAESDVNEENSPTN